ncbi:hypothetical protein GCM10017044_23720 [Kordiimonas sediminis]|uniref:Uncharacterized protein n=1 Tax=Kordiimonas sediminis TaxID=1735581 RepID=A0A919E867_9PROT|nr:hypothetical protein GCM10017044_23720 [Kordiimonas sediminis]
MPFKPNLTVNVEGTVSPSLMPMKYTDALSSAEMVADVISIAAKISTFLNTVFPFVLWNFVEGYSPSIVQQFATKGISSLMHQYK